VKSIRLIAVTAAHYIINPVCLPLQKDIGRAEQECIMVDGVCVPLLASAVDVTDAIAKADRASRDRLLHRPGATHLHAARCIDHISPHDDQSDHSPSPHRGRPPHIHRSQCTSASLISTTPVSGCFVMAFGLTGHDLTQAGRSQC
jgi:hypothetical protein